MASKLFLKLIEKKQLTGNVTAFVFERPKDLIFLAGQYIRIFDSVAGESVFRDFTISSSPHEKETLTLTIKHGITEYKKTLFSMPVGTKFYVEAPMGRFYLNENETRPHVFIAGGVGVAPFFSMITSLTKQKKKLPLTLFASYSTVEDILFVQEFEKLQQECSHLQTIYTISQPEKSQTDWNGHTGHINKSLIKEYVDDISLPQFLISGPPSFVNDIEDLLTQMQVGLHQIRTEVFLGFY